jgi:hypothetical protein
LNAGRDRVDRRGHQQDAVLHVTDEGVRDAKHRRIDGSPGRMGKLKRHIEVPDADRGLHGVEQQQVVASHAPARGKCHDQCR